MRNAVVRSGWWFACFMIVCGVAPSGASAQSLGTFSWQMQPFCNVIRVTVTQVSGNTYTLHGVDDQCGAAQAAPLTGVATINPDGSIGFGLHSVAAPSVAPVSIEARIGLATLSGSWQDDSGNSGGLVFGASAGGTPRPVLTGARVFSGAATNFTLTSSTTVNVPMPIAMFNRGSWQVYLVRASGNIYPVPGPGLNGASTYRVFATPSGGQTSIVVSLATGTGEDYTEVRVVRVQ